MKAAITSFIIVFNYFVGAYFGIVNTIYAVLLTLALFAIIRHIRRVKYSRSGSSAPRRRRRRSRS